MRDAQKARVQDLSLGAVALLPAEAAGAEAPGAAAVRPVARGSS